MSASPRWTFGKGGLDTVSYGATTGTVHEPPKRKPKYKSRETYIDELLRAEEDQGTGEHLGPGSHDPLPVERVFQEPDEVIHGKTANRRRNLGGGGEIARTHRRLPTVKDTPGPGHYTQFSSFGASSGPSRATFLPKALPDHAVGGNSVREGTRSSVVGLGRQGALSIRSPRV